MLDPKVVELRRRIGIEVTGNPDFMAMDYASLDPKTQIIITNRMKAEIRANPDQYTKTQVRIAGTPDIEEPTPFGVLDAAKSAVEGATEGATNYAKDLKGLATIATIAVAALTIANFAGLIKRPSNKS